jgi:hypothetical protein
LKPEKPEKLKIEKPEKLKSEKKFVEPYQTFRIS